MTGQIYKSAALSWTLFGVLGVSACSSVPYLDEVDNERSRGPTVAEMASQVRCEVHRAVRKNRSAFENKHWAAVATLTLQVDDVISASPTLTFFEPVEFSFGLGAGVSGSRQRIYTQTLTYDLDKLANLAAPQNCDGRSRLAGDLRFLEMVRTALASGNSNSKSFGQTLQFVVVKNLNGVGPTWTLARFKGPGGLFGASRTDTQKLVISFAAPEGAKGTSAALEGRGLSPADAGHAAAVEAATAQNLNMILQSLDLN